MFLGIQQLKGFSLLESLSPLQQLLALVVILGAGFLLLVMYLDANENFALKRDWREKKKSVDK